MTEEYATIALLVLISVKLAIVLGMVRGLKHAIYTLRSDLSVAQHLPPPTPETTVDQVMNTVVKVVEALPGNLNTVVDIAQSAAKVVDQLDGD
jgi:hypothetical protein